MNPSRFLFMLEKINMPEVTQIAISVLIKTAPSKQLLFLPCRENTAFRAWVLWHSIIIYSMNQNLMFFLRGAVLFVVLLWRQGIKQRFSSCYLSIPLIWHSSLKDRFIWIPDLIYLRVKYKPLVFCELKWPLCLPKYPWFSVECEHSW